MDTKKIIDEKGILTQEGMELLARGGDSVSCECPHHLIELLKKVKEFTKYQENCLTEKPGDELTHNWLKSTSVNLEHLLSSTILNLARLEGLLDENNSLIE